MQSDALGEQPTAVDDDGSALAPDGSVPSGEEIAAQVEHFLAQLGQRPDEA